MQTVDTPNEASSVQQADKSRFNPYSGLAGFVKQSSKQQPGVVAALRRLDPGALRPNELAALAQALLAAGLDTTNWLAATWPRWALVTHGIALAGHDGTRRLGDQLFEANVSASRVTKLLTARGDAFTQLLPSVLRLLASRGVAPNWHELGGLVLGDADPARHDETEEIRLRIAGSYFSARARADHAK